MCKSTHDVGHQALVMSQDTRARQNEFFASKNYPSPPLGPELNPMPYVNYEMPPFLDEMFYGYTMSAHGRSRLGVKTEWIRVDSCETVFVIIFFWIRNRSG
jgi:hypothetical protein